MKDNIKTAEEIYVKYFGSVNTTTRKSTSKHNIIEAMKEYAEQFIDLAVEEVKTKTSRTMWQGMSDFVEITEVDRESILKVKQLIK